MIRADSPFTVEELVLAYELFVDGCCWKRIARGLGCDWQAIKDHVRNVELGGIHDAREVVPSWAIAGAHTMRANSRLSWNAIGRHYGFTGDQMRSAYWRRHGKILT